MLLDNAVELEGLGRMSANSAKNTRMVGTHLTGSQLEGAVAVLLTDSVHVQPLLRRAHTSGQSHSDHERVGRFETLRLEGLSDISVVL